MVMGVPWPAAMLLLGSLHCSTSLELVAGMKFHGGSGESASTGPQAVASRAHDLDGLLVASTPSDPSAVGDSGPLSDGTVTSTSGRTLLHGCHGNKRRVKKRCLKNLPQCPLCRFPRGGRRGHCKKGSLRKLFNCESFRNFGGGVGSGRDSAQGTANAASVPRYTSVYYDDDYTYEYVDEYGDFISETRYIYELQYEPENVDAESNAPSGPLDLASVGTPTEFQAALEAGVRHIALTAHLDMRQSASPPDINGIEALDNAVGRVADSTASIVGRCDGQAPASFKLKEALPPGACAVLVKEDFLDIPLGSGRQGGGLLLDSLYVAEASPTRSGSSVLLLHVDGQVWITNSVFQGAGHNVRAIDVSTANGGSPKLYVKGTVFTGFTRTLAPGIRVTQGATAMLDGVKFSSMELLRKRKGTVIEAAAIAAYPSATLSLTGVTFEDNVVYSEPAGDRAVAVAAGREGSAVYAEPRLRVWQWPGGPATLSQPKSAVTSFLDDEVAPVTAALRAAEKVQEVAEEAYLAAGRT